MALVDHDHDSHTQPTTESAHTVTPDRYCEIRSLTEALAAPLSAEDQTVQSMPDVSPTKWHRAHTSWFFETFVLEEHAPGHRPFHPAYRYLFNSYYEAVGPRHARPQRGLLSRPGASDITEYRRFVDAAMTDLLAAGSAGGAVVDLVELGLHHEQQHQELLLMDIKHVLSCNPLQPTYRPGNDAARTAETPVERPTGWVEHPGGVVTTGHAGVGFCFDNEQPRHRSCLEPFALADRPVSCGDWLAFIDDGGYRRAELWLSDGWATVQAQGWDAPLYWHPDGDGHGWSVFTLHGTRAVDPAEPVCHISYYEADAFARWAGGRLPTEPEWEVMASEHAVEGPAFDVDHLQPRASAAMAMPAGVWEWTASAYLPYPGYRPAAGAVGEYNGKFMVNQHVLRGGACVTPPGHTRLTYRNFFPPAARWPFTGARIAKELS